MIHTATLLHDDVVDESDAAARPRHRQRRSSATPRRVLVGDFLYSRAFQMMVGSGRMRVLEILADATNVIAEGEVLQLMNAGNADLDEARLPRSDPAQDRQAVRGGRAAGRGAGRRDAGRARTRWRATACTSAPRSSSSTTCSTIRATAESIGKNLGDDLAEGKMTLPLIRAHATGSADDAALIRHAIAGGGLTDFAPVVAALERTGALAYARGRAPRAKSAARPTAWPDLPDSPHRQNLLELTTFAAQRTY